VRPDQAEELAFVNVEVHFAQRVDASVADAEVAYRQHCHGRTSSVWASAGLVPTTSAGGVDCAAATRPARAVRLLCARRWLAPATPSGLAIRVNSSRTPPASSSQ